ncbi:MAG: amino acid ABC transporter permease [Anaerorhabdus sp.]
MGTKIGMTLESMITAETLSFMLNGALISLTIALCAFVVGIALGIVGASMRISKNKVLRACGRIYVEVIRGTPMLLQILFLYLGFPAIYTMITGGVIRLNPYVVGTVAISINSGAYATELIRGGILSIDKGQWEAAKTLGMSNKLTMRKIILPQAFKIILPPLVSEFIVLIKDSCLISTIGGVELLQSAQILGVQHYNYLPFLVAASIMYLIMTSVVSVIAGRVEKKVMSYD